MKKQKEGIISCIDVPMVNWRTLKFKSSENIIELIDTYGSDILYTVDESGFMPIHWAVVNGTVEYVDKIIKAGVSPRLRAKIYDEPEPIHLAAHVGNIKVIDLLVSYGIDIDVKDRSGCTPMIRAAMCGKNYKTKSSETILHLISNGADMVQTDADGLNCLHYAVLSNNEDTVHLLLNLGLDPNQCTNKGFRAIDFAIKNGSEYLIKLLGSLTYGISQNHLNNLLVKYTKKTTLEKLYQILKCFAEIIVILMVFSALFYALPQYILYYLPKTSSDITFHITLMISLALILIFLYKTCASDPGYLPLNTIQYKKVLESKMKSSLRTYSSQRPKFDLYKDIRLCHTCKTIQTHRSTHCRYCKRCIAYYDHHCIYLSTCIGLNNRMAFFGIGFTLFLFGLLSTYLVVNLAVAEQTLFTPYHWLNMCYTIVYLITGGVLTLCNFRRAALNLTTNEEFKYFKYSYFTSSEGQFVNPFDRGSYFRNIIDYFSTKPHNYSKLNAYEC